MNVVSDYAQCVGCEMEKKEKFWSELAETIESFPREESVDWNRLQ